MRIQLDVDDEMALRKLTWRERVGIRLLLLVFLMIYPAKYAHQVTHAFEDIFRGEA